MGKATKTVAELEAMILGKMQLSASARMVTWEAMVMSLNEVAYADCVARVTRYAAVLRTEYALAD
jgi:hypothetical protein